MSLCCVYVCVRVSLKTQFFIVKPLILRAGFVNFPLHCEYCSISNIARHTCIRVRGREKGTVYVCACVYVFVWLCVVVRECVCTFVCARAPLCVYVRAHIYIRARARMCAMTSTSKASVAAAAKPGSCRMGWNCPSARALTLLAAKLAMWFMKLRGKKIESGS